MRPAAPGGLALRLEPLPVRMVLDGVRGRFIDRAASHDRDIVVDVEGDYNVLGDLGGAADQAARLATLVRTLSLP